MYSLTLFPKLGSLTAEEAGRITLSFAAFPNVSAPATANFAVVAANAENTDHPFERAATGSSKIFFSSSCGSSLSIISIQM